MAQNTSSDFNMEEALCAELKVKVPEIRKAGFKSSVTSFLKEEQNIPWLILAHHYKEKLND